MAIPPDNWTLSAHLRPAFPLVSTPLLTGMPSNPRAEVRILPGAPFDLRLCSTGRIGGGESVANRLDEPIRFGTNHIEEQHALMHERSTMYLGRPSAYRSTQQRQNGCPAGSA